THTQQRTDIRIMGLRRQWVNEKEHDVNGFRRDHRSDLCVTALGPAEQLLHDKAHLVFQESRRIARGDECETCDGFSVEGRPCDELHLLAVMSDQSKSHAWDPPLEIVADVSSR